MLGNHSRYSSSKRFLEMLCGFAPNEIFVPLRFILAVIAITKQINANGRNMASEPHISPPMDHNQNNRHMDRRQETTTMFCRIVSALRERDTEATKINPRVAIPQEI